MIFCDSVQRLSINSGFYYRPENTIHFPFVSSATAGGGGKGDFRNKCFDLLFIKSLLTPLYQRRYFRVN